MPVMLVNCFEVPAGRDDEFFALWREVNGYMSGKPGYVSHRMHRSLTPDARFRFVNYAVWDTEGQWAAAHDEGFRALMANPAWAPFKPTFAMYELVHTGGAEARMP